MNTTNYVSRFVGGCRNTSELLDGVDDSCRRILLFLCNVHTRGIDMIKVQKKQKFGEAIEFDVYSAHKI